MDVVKELEFKTASAIGGITTESEKGSSVDLASRLASGTGPRNNDVNPAY